MTSFSEGIPVVLMEAMAAGVPVVAPRITGIPELVEDDVNGLLYVPGDEGQLVKQIELLIMDAHLRNRLSENATKTDSLNILTYPMKHSD